MTRADHLGARAEESVMLSGFLDWYREVIERKVQGLSLFSYL